MGGRGTDRPEGPRLLREKGEGEAESRRGQKEAEQKRKGRLGMPRAPARQSRPPTTSTHSRRMSCSHEDKIALPTHHRRSTKPLLMMSSSLMEDSLALSAATVASGIRLCVLQASCCLRARFCT